MKYFCVLLLKIYKNTLSKIIGRECKFTPSCSVFSMEAFLEHGFFKGFLMTVKRLARCSPFSKKAGFDPVPFNPKGKIKWSL